MKRNLLLACAAASVLLPSSVSAQSADAGLVSLDSLLAIRISTAARYEQTTREREVGLSGAQELTRHV